MTRNRILLILVALLIAGGGVLVSVREPARVLPPEFEQSIETPAQSLTKVRFGPEGKTVLAGGATGTVVSVTLENSRVQRLAPATDDPLTCLAESPDGLILAGSASGRLRAWTRLEFEKTPVASPKLAVTCAAFGAERSEKRMALGLVDGRIVLKTRDEQFVRETDHRGVKTLLMAADGKTLISSGSEGLILWHDADSGAALGELKEHRSEVAALVASPEFDRLASGDWNGELRVIDVKTRKVVARAQQPEAVSGLAWRGDLLITSSWDGDLRTWKINETRLELSHEIKTGRPIYGMSVNSDASLAATVGGDSAIELWELSVSP
ncbi:MAG: WD40 repeat domain-containing protein [Planctomycetota bacterium]|jgi:WD40 repeat protein